MAPPKATKYEDFEAELLSRPGIRREYEALKPKYEMIRSLIERRNQLKLSQTQVAEMVGTKQPAICRLEKGDCNTTLNTLFKVADVLGMDICLKAKKRLNKNPCEVNA